MIEDVMQPAEPARLETEDEVSLADRMKAGREAILGEIRKIYLNEEKLLDGKAYEGLIPPEKIDPLARLGGNFYSSLGKVFSINRPM